MHNMNLLEDVSSSCALRLAIKNNEVEKKTKKMFSKFSSFRKNILFEDQEPQLLSYKFLGAQPEITKVRNITSRTFLYL